MASKAQVYREKQDEADRAKPLVHGPTWYATVSDLGNAEFCRGGKFALLIDVEDIPALVTWLQDTFLDGYEPPEAMLEAWKEVTH